MPIFRAVIYAVYRSGFFPTSAMEDDNALDMRMDKLLRIIGGCKYGIHDISRTELDRNGFPRFNMPFELGVFFAARRFGQRIQKNKSAIVFERTRYTYQQYLSDLNGVDTKAHNNDPYSAIRGVRNWLRTASRRSTIPHAPFIIAEFRDFEVQLPVLSSGLGFTNINEIPFNDYCTIVEEFIRGKLASI